MPNEFHRLRELPYGCDKAIVCQHSVQALDPALIVGAQQLFGDAGMDETTFLFKDNGTVPSEDADMDSREEDLLALTEDEKARWRGGGSPLCHSKGTPHPNPSHP